MKFEPTLKWRHSKINASGAQERWTWGTGEGIESVGLEVSVESLGVEGLSRVSE